MPIAMATVMGGGNPIPTSELMLALHQQFTAQRGRLQQQFQAITSISPALLHQHVGPGLPMLTSTAVQQDGSTIGVAGQIEQLQNMMAIHAERDQEIEEPGTPLQPLPIEGCEAMEDEAGRMLDEVRPVSII